MTNGDPDGADSKNKPHTGQQKIVKTPKKQIPKKYDEKSIKKK